MTPDAQDRKRLAGELDAIERLVSDAGSRAANLERIIGVIHALGGNTAAAERALMSTYQTLGVLTNRRCRLLAIAESYGYDLPSAGHPIRRILRP